ncbi:MAG: hypothetical protein MUE98_02595 [Rhodobacteraceae bacterium]|nr:hypothetical protein [Paracoccaceae bacterium]
MTPDPRVLPRLATRLLRRRARAPGLRDAQLPAELGDHLLRDIGVGPERFGLAPTLRLGPPA